MLQYIIITFITIKTTIQNILDSDNRLTTESPALEAKLGNGCGNELLALDYSILYSLYDIADVQGPTSRSQVDDRRDVREEQPPESFVCVCFVHATGVCDKKKASG